MPFYPKSNEVLHTTQKPNDDDTFPEFVEPDRVN